MGKRTQAPLLIISLLIVPFLIFAIAQIFPKDWGTLPRPIPTPTLGVVGSAIAIDNIVNWPMCKDAKARAKDVEEIDISGMTGATDQMKDERICFRYAFRISARRGRTYCSTGSGSFPPGEMTGPYFEFVALDSRAVRVMTW